MIFVQEEFAKMPPESFNFVFFLIAAHGGRDRHIGEYFKCSDGGRIPIRELEEIFLGEIRPNGLLGVPKVFVYNVCRGDRPRLIASLNSNESTTWEKEDAERAPPQSVIYGAEFVDGVVTWSDYMFIWGAERQTGCLRSPESGSVLIQLLCSAIDEEPCDDLADLVRRINRCELSRRDEDGNLRAASFLIQNDAGKFEREGVSFPVQVNMNRKLRLTKATKPFKRRL